MGNSGEKTLPESVILKYLKLKNNFYATVAYSGLLRQ